jgi:hypothetical protein
MNAFRAKLPAFKMKEELLRAVAINQVNDDILLWGMDEILSEWRSLATNI